VSRKTTTYYRFTKQRPDRQIILDAWIEQVILHPTHEETQTDGRIRRWAKISEFENRWLRVILLEDGETLHNAFFDRNFGGEG
jgi:hypothetical protein